MENKYKITFVLLIIGAVITVIGTLFRIMHWPFGSVLLTVGVLIEMISLLSLIVVLLKKNK